jgi:hypothetical protein
MKIGLGTAIKWAIRPFVFAIDLVFGTGYMRCDKCEDRRKRLDAKYNITLPLGR